MGARRKVVVVLVALTAALAVAGPVGARSTSSAKDVTLTATVTFASGWCCGTSTDFEGEAVIPRVGAVAFTGNWLSGCLFFPGDVSYPCFRRLDIEFVTRNGSVLSLKGDNEWTFPTEVEPTVLTWSVDPAASTGRFSSFSGAGTYALALEGSSVTIELSGVLQPAVAS